MKYPTVRAKIVKMEDGAGYEGKVYDQYVFIELSNVKVISLFDGDMSSSHDLLSKIRDITIDVIFATVEKLSEPKYGVEPFVPEQGKHYTPGFGHIFFGKIEEMCDRHHRLSVDIGVGKIMVSPGQQEYKTFQVGDFVKILTSRADLFKIYD